MLFMEKNRKFIYCEKASGMEHKKYCSQSPFFRCSPHRGMTAKAADEQKQQKRMQEKRGESEWVSFQWFEIRGLLAISVPFSCVKASQSRYRDPRRRDIQIVHRWWREEGCMGKQLVSMWAVDFGCHASLSQATIPQPVAHFLLSSQFLRGGKKFDNQKCFRGVGNGKGVASRLLDVGGGAAFTPLSNAGRKMRGRMEKNIWWN